MSKRADANKNLSKVAKILLEDPLKTEREIAKETWLGKSTVNRQKQELGQNGAKDDRIKGLLDKDLDILNMIQAQKIEELQQKKVSHSDIDKWENTANKRRIMFWEKDESEEKTIFIIQ